MQRQPYIIPHPRPGCYQKALTPAEWAAILLAQGWRCFYCGNFVYENAPAPRENAEQDHLWPLIHNGCSCSGNHVAACGICNRMKQGMVIPVFLAKNPQLRRTIGKFSTRIVLIRGAQPQPWQLLPVEFADKFTALTTKKAMHRAIGLPATPRRCA